MRLAWLALPIFVAVALSPPRADAAPKECVAHHEEGKTLRRKGALVAAKEAFVKCGQDACPNVIREECRELLTKTATETPTIVVAAQDERGKDLQSGRTVLDGVDIQDALGGRAVAVDPGPHTLRVVLNDGRSAETQFVARNGEKDRAVRLAFAAAIASKSTTTTPSQTPVPASKAAAGMPVASYLLGGMAVLALASFAGFALDGKSRQSKLDECKPHCKQSDVDAMHRSYLIADVSLGVGILSLGGATYFFLARGKEQEPTATALSRGPLFPPVVLGVSGAF